MAEKHFSHLVYHLPIGFKHFFHFVVTFVIFCPYRFATLFSKRSLEITLPLLTRSKKISQSASEWSIWAPTCPQVWWHFGKACLKIILQIAQDLLKWRQNSYFNPNLEQSGPQIGAAYRVLMHALVLQIAQDLLKWRQNSYTTPTWSNLAPNLVQHIVYLCMRRYFYFFLLC